MFNTLYYIAKNTFRESVREPIYLLLTTAALCMIGAFPVCTMFVFNGQEKLVIDSAMATTMVFGWIIAVLIASYTISREIENGTALLMLSKPVQRPVFILAKILGIVAALFVFAFVCSFASMVALRIAIKQNDADLRLMGIYYVGIILAYTFGGAYNYITRQSFASGAVTALFIIMPIVATIAHFMPFEGITTGVSPRILPALLLIAFSVCAMGTLATTLSTRFSLVPNMLLCAFIFCLGLMSDYFIGRNTKEVWERLPMPGNAPLWVAKYTFDPKETADIEMWENPDHIDTLSDFIVYSANPNAVTSLGDMGSSPELYWNDSDDWKFNLKDLQSKPVMMGLYDTSKRTWKFVDFNYDKFIKSNLNKSMSEREPYTAYIFRRSYTPPRTPKGGTYQSPMPLGGHPIVNVFYAAIPNWQLFWMADALSTRGTDIRIAGERNVVPPAYIVYATLYTIALEVLLALIAIILFQNREVGKQLVV